MFCFWCEHLSLMFCLSGDTDVLLLPSLVYFTLGRQFHEVKNVSFVPDMWPDVGKQFRYGSNIEICLEICLVWINEKYNRFLFRISEGVKLPRNFGRQETIIWRSDIEARRRNKTQLDEDVKVWSLETITWVRHLFLWRLQLNLTKMSKSSRVGCWRRLLGSAFPCWNKNKNKTKLDEDVKVWSREMITWVSDCIKLNLTKMSNFLVAGDDYLGQRETFPRWPTGKKWDWPIVNASTSKRMVSLVS